MTLPQLVALNRARGGYFFSRETMSHFGDTIKSFSIKNDKKAGIVTVTHKKDGRKWNFDTQTGRIVYAVQFQEKLDGIRAIVTA